MQGLDPTPPCLSRQLTLPDLSFLVCKMELKQPLHHRGCWEDFIKTPHVLPSIHSSCSLSVNIWGLGTWWVIAALSPPTEPLLWSPFDPWKNPSGESAWYNRFCLSADDSFLAGWPGKGCLTSWCLKFLIRHIVIIIVPPPSITMRIQYTLCRNRFSL